VKQRWDIFCDVVDNFGDIGICWRLARQLASEYPVDIRLWVNKLAVAKKIIPELDIESVSLQTVDNVHIGHWPSDGQEQFKPVDVAEVVIEAFACELPPAYVAAMTSSTIWINLEYLSAEPWVAGLHANVSILPATGLKKTFFFPGFTTGTGGLIREGNLLSTRDAFLSSSSAQAAFWQSLELGHLASSKTIKISLFSYEHAPVADLLESLSCNSPPVICIFPVSDTQSATAKQVAACFNHDSLLPGDKLVKGNLTLYAIPFLLQHQYDQLLWSCDLNFVRGEDSWVRAIWAGKPFVWQPYYQDDDVHLDKLQAFLDIYYQGLADPASQAISDIHAAWVDGRQQDANVRPAFQSLLANLEGLHRHAQQQCLELAMQGDLAAKLVIFCANKV